MPIPKRQMSDPAVSDARVRSGTVCGIVPDEMAEPGQGDPWLNLIGDHRDHRERHGMMLASRPSSGNFELWIAMTRVLRSTAFHRRYHRLHRTPFCDPLNPPCQATLRSRPGDWCPFPTEPWSGQKTPLDQPHVQIAPPLPKICERCIQTVATQKKTRKLQEKLRKRCGRSSRFHGLLHRAARFSQRPQIEESDARSERLGRCSSQRRSSLHPEHMFGSRPTRGAPSLT